ncbi:hypothetical protein SEA_VIBAKI_32 [Arthrobacter phage Vibaki]|uniref:Uncharacterized protein n=1 Tax=Arthrobacter phage Vibaki TaxID=2593333 RepID=A0A514TYZ2_9CAUD|nr:hypothetical protein HYP95_gp32 [Arthrobacter phage Vibaki]QDK01913.1 hypothetical protein SEA_VIBAKI_32 [Arthrobacter phage Vibaki]
MSSPDRADTVAVIEEAITRAAEYWGGPHDVEALEFAKLIEADVVITSRQFQELVESKIAFEYADQHADLSRFGWPDNCSWFTRSEFIRQHREQWYDPTMRAVLSATRAPRQFDELIEADRLAVSA